MKNRDRWSALSMKDRADLIKLYVDNGITSLDSIKRDYNSFGDGGEKEEVNIPSDGYFRDLAYRISVNPKVSARGFAPVKTIIKELGNSNENVSVVDDNKLTYLYGNINGLYPAEDSSGKDFSTYLKRTYPIKYKKGKIKEYQGTLNPFNEYVFDERDRVLVEELAKKGKGVYSNADTEYDYMADVYDENEPYRDDVASYHMKFVNTPNGYAVSASDLYDFGPDYKANKYGDTNPAQVFMSNVQGRLMGLVGNPFILRQDNVPIRFIDTVNGSIEHRYGEDASRAKGLRDAIDRAMLSDKEREEGILPEEKIAQILETGYIQPSIVTSNANGGKLNKFVTGGNTENISDSNWTLSYKDLPDGYKQVVINLAKGLNYDTKNIEEIYNSGVLKAPIQARFRGAPSARVRQNDSPTKEASEVLEGKMNKVMYNSTDRVLPNMKYAIPYIEGLGITVPGVGRTTTNALDSLAKYAYKAKIPLYEALGLSAQETAFGALPQYNYKDIKGTEEEKQEAGDFNRALGNASYFRNYGLIPAENFVRDFRYNIVEDPISRDIPPLLHAFEYWKKGNYNRGDPNHTSDVKSKGRTVMNTEVIQEWIKNSELAQKALNLFK